MIEDYNHNDYKDFAFKSFAKVKTNVIELSLAKTNPASQHKHWIPYYHFFILKNGVHIGYINFRVGNTSAILEYDGHIGYFVQEKYRGYCAAYHASTLLLPFIRDHGFKSIVMTCHPNNIASTKTIEHLGATFQCHREFPYVANDHDKEKNIFLLKLKAD